MSAPVTVVLDSKQRRAQAVAWIANAADGSVIELSPPRRTLPQNKRLHAMCTDLSRQIDWPVGSGQKRTVEDWKDITTAALLSATRGLDVVPGMNGGFVLLGMHTSEMSVAHVGDLMTLIEAFGAEHGVRFRDPPPNIGDELSPASQGARRKAAVEA